MSAAGAQGKLDLDPGIVAACRQAAKQIADQVSEEVSGRTTVSVERSVTRLLGVDGADSLEVPLPNVLVDHVQAGGGLGRGVAHWLGNAMIQTGRTPQQLAEAVSAGELDLFSLEMAEDGAIHERVGEECAARLAEIRRRFAARSELRDRLDTSTAPLRYVLTATGDVYEDVVHAKAVAEAGGDIVAVIRSTAQSLLDYVQLKLKN